MEPGIETWKAGLRVQGQSSGSGIYMCPNDQLAQSFFTNPLWPLSWIAFFLEQERIQLETARLYRTAGVNPLAGKPPRNVRSAGPQWQSLLMLLSVLGVPVESLCFLVKPTSARKHKSVLLLCWCPRLSAHPRNFASLDWAIPGTQQRGQGGVWLLPDSAVPALQLLLG